MLRQQDVEFFSDDQKLAPFTEWKNRRRLLRFFLKRVGENCRFLEIGINNSETPFDLCGDIEALNGSYTGVDISFRSMKRAYANNYCVREYSDKFKFIEEDSRLFFRHLKLEEEYDLIFVDGGHDFNPAFSDTFFALQHISNRGFILMHDVGPLDNTRVFPEWNGALQSYNILCKQNPYIYARILPYQPEGMGVAFWKEKNIL